MEKPKEKERQSVRERARETIGVRLSGKTADRLSTHDWSVCQSGGASVWCCLSLSLSTPSLTSPSILPFVLSLSRTLFPNAPRSTLGSLPLARFPIGRGPTSKKTSLIRMAEWQSRLPIVRPVHMDRSARPPPKDNRQSLSCRYSPRMKGRFRRSRFHCRAHESSSLAAFLFVALDTRLFSHRLEINCWLSLKLSSWFVYHTIAQSCDAKLSYNCQLGSNLRISGYSMI